MAQVDIHISFEESTFEGQKITGVSIVPQIGSRIVTRYGWRRVVDVVYDYALDGSGDCDVHIKTTSEAYDGRL